MRIGTSLTEADGPDALSALADEIRRAADDGFASGWISNIFGLDALTALAVAGHGVPGIELGTAVVPTYPRHPAALAQQALTARWPWRAGWRWASGCRTRSSSRTCTATASTSRPGTCASTCRCCCRCWTASRPAFDGETVRAHIGLSVPRPVSQTSRIPVLLAAHGPADAAGWPASGPTGRCCG